jgi:lipopolysaccharide transport system permease protein
VVTLGFEQPPKWSWVLLPIIIVLWQLFTFGVSLALSTINVFFRDVGQVLTVVLQVWFWSLPVVYFEDVLPPAYRAGLQFNPAYPFLTSMRAALFEGMPPLVAWVSMVGWTVVVLVGGYFVLTRLKSEIRDLL